jgi:hypothetical protein
VSQTHDEIRALRVMVDELRAEPPPELAWDAVEQRLLARLAQEDRDAHGSVRKLHTRTLFAPGSAQKAPASSFSRVVGFAAAAAVLAFGVGSMSRSAEIAGTDAPPRHVVEVSSFGAAPGSSARDLSRLAQGDVVEAGDAPVTFAQAGLVAWTLAPGSALRVSSVGVGHTVTLERGAIRAEVTPRDPSEGLVEAFAVEVGGTRVAVHGTAFSVKIAGDRILVDVEHGTVAVGPKGHVGVTTGHMLVGPTRASFSLDGGRSARLVDRTPDAFVTMTAAPARSEPVAMALPGSEPVAVPAVVPPGDAPVAADHGAAHPIDGALAVVAPRHGAAAHPAPAAQPAAAPAAPPEPPRLTADIVRARLERCFRQQADATRESGVSTLHIDPISTTLSIDLNPDGTTRSSRFTTRIKTELVLCAGSAISGRFADGLGHVDIPVTFQP